MPSSINGSNITYCGGVNVLTGRLFSILCDGDKMLMGRLCRVDRFGRVGRFGMVSM